MNKKTPPKKKYHVEQGTVCTDIDTVKSLFEDINYNLKTEMFYNKETTK